MLRTKALWALLVFLLVSLTASVIVAVTPRDPHPAASACTTCHLSAASPEQGKAVSLVAAQELLCAKCHAAAVKLSHPSGFTPQRTLPAEFPLDWKGDLTCSTCHATHGKTAGLLRGSKRGKEFCLSCHESTFFSRMKDAGTSLVQSGHIQQRRSGIDVDAHSLHCLGCHTSGSYAGGGTVSLGTSGVIRHASGAVAHPIGRTYPDAGRRADYHPQAQLAQKNVLLSDGKLSCISCHEVYKKEHGRLVMTMERSALCLACHAK